MDLNSFNYLDITIGTIVIILGIKGMMNGLIKELFGLIGLIGGVYIASRMSEQVGEIIDRELFHLDNPAALKLIGFMSLFAGVWIVSVAVGAIFSRLIKMSGLGFIDGLFGFVFGGGKYFLIFALIITALSNVTLVKENVGKYFDDSVLYPYLKSAGSYLINLDGDSFKKADTNTTVALSPSSIKGLDPIDANISMGQE
ncbi:Colicin V production protein [hydrothermal vent metagenome]|uniref:Colicin V production protein n=1 Tax=hydrothermal vent metagenome TaxID=652676 RepID=A0A1W1BS73_9ZZZZ